MKVKRLHSSGTDSTFQTSLASKFGVDSAHRAAEEGWKEPGFWIRRSCPAPGVGGLACFTRDGPTHVRCITPAISPSACCVFVSHSFKVRPTKLPTKRQNWLLHDSVMDHSDLARRPCTSIQFSREESLSERWKQVTDIAGSGNTSRCLQTNCKFIRIPPSNQT
jgi:hypothetical protein